MKTLAKLNIIIQNVQNIKFLNYKDKEIMYVSIANLDVVREKQKILDIIEESKKIIKKTEPESVLIITDITNAGFCREVSNAFKEYTKSNTPHIKGSAIVGLSGMQKVVYNIIKKITGRTFFLAKDIEEAKEWLVKL